MMDVANNKQKNVNPTPQIHSHKNPCEDVNKSTEYETAKDDSAGFLALNLRPPSFDQTLFLRKTFGLEQMKPLQWRVIQSIMEEKRDQVVQYRLNIMMNYSDY